MKVIENYTYKKIEPSRQTILLSVVVAVYNIAEYLPRCVHSIQAQTWSRLDIILVDDGSTDNSGILCDELAAADGRIRVIHKDNGGLSDARNAGTAAAVGEYIAFVDGDDWIQPDMYENMLSCILDFKAPLAVCRYRQIYKDNIVDGSTQRVVLLEEKEALEEFIAENDSIPIRNAAWNKVYSRELMGNLCFPKGRLYEDIVYTTRLLERCQRCIYLDRAEYNYVLEREGSIMGGGIGERIFTDQIPAYQEKEAFLRSIGRHDLAWQHRYFFYKRLLQYYIRCAGSKDPLQKQYCRRIRILIGEGKEDMGRIYSCKGANPNDKKKMMIFLRSPFLYRLVMCLNEKLVLPVKHMRKG